MPASFSRTLTLPSPTMNRKLLCGRNKCNLGRGGKKRETMAGGPSSNKLLCKNRFVPVSHGDERFNFLECTETWVGTVWATELSFFFMQLNWAIESIRLFVHPEESKTSSLSSLRSDLRACCRGVTFPSLAGHLGRQGRGNRFSLCLSVCERTWVFQDLYKYLFSWNCLYMTLVSQCWRPALFGVMIIVERQDGLGRVWGRKTKGQLT